MTRTMFFFTALCAMLAALCAVLIRIELAAPGISPLFAATDGLSDGQKFSQTSSAHIFFANLSVMALGTTMASAARAKGAAFAGLLRGLGVLACAVIVVLGAMAATPLSSVAPVDQTGVSWMLYPPLPSESTLSWVSRQMQLDWLLPAANQILFLAAAFFLISGTYLMVSTGAGLRWIGGFGIVIVGGVTAFAAPEAFQSALYEVSAVYVIAALPLLAALAVRLIDTAESWVLILALGLIACVAGQVALLVVFASSYVAGTMVEAVALYVFPLGLAWFGLPALVLFDRGGSLGPIASAFVVAAPVAALALWIVPLVQIGLAGQPAFYVDYPEALVGLNFIATFGVFCFVTVYLAAVILARRAD